MSKKTYVTITENTKNTARVAELKQFVDESITKLKNNEIPASYDEYLSTMRGIINRKLMELVVGFTYIEVHKDNELKNIVLKHHKPADANQLIKIKDIFREYLDAENIYVKSTRPADWYTGGELTTSVTDSVFADENGVIHFKVWRLPADTHVSMGNIGMLTNNIKGDNILAQLTCGMDSLIDMESLVDMTILQQKIHSAVTWKNIMRVSAIVLAVTGVGFAGVAVGKKFFSHDTIEELDEVTDDVTDDIEVAVEDDDESVPAVEMEDIPM